MGESPVNKAPAKIAGMFDSIAKRYDTLNHLLSAGLDRRWRTRAVQALHFAGTERVLDMCTGTGDLAVAAISAGAADVIGVDFAAEMLRFAKLKVQGLRMGGRIRLVRGDATLVPLPDASCDAATIGFGIRNVLDPAAACREFSRVLRPGGQLAVLEFGFPRIPGIRTAYVWYFKYLLPRVGRLISRHGDAYSYLPASVAQFPSSEAFTAMVRANGFSDVRAVPLSLGIVYLYVARRS